MSGTYSHIQRKKQVQKLLTQIQKQSVYTFCHSHKSSSVDSHSRRMINVMVDNISERHAGKVWDASIVNDQYTLFLESSTIEDCIARYGSEFVVPIFFLPESMSLYRKTNDAVMC